MKCSCWRSWFGLGTRVISRDIFCPEHGYLKREEFRHKRDSFSKIILKFWEFLPIRLLWKRN
jgi:hypothetical protein